MTLLHHYQGFKSQAMAVTCDPEHKFELALQLGDVKIAYDLAKEAEVRVKIITIIYNIHTFLFIVFINRSTI